MSEEQRKGDEERMQEKKKDCPCKRVNCERHGDCAACREYHHAQKRKPLPACEKADQKKGRKARRSRRVAE